jgi:hypothetical protein
MYVNNGVTVGLERGADLKIHLKHFIAQMIVS